MASGGLGYALPGAVGVALARPGKRVVCLIGDGSLMYSVQALWTAAQHGLPVSVIVQNNAGDGAMRAFSRVVGVTGAPGIDLPGLDLVALARGHGVVAARAERARDLDAALARAVSTPGPFLLDVALETRVEQLYAEKE